MPWLRLDDKMRRHPKVTRLSDRAHRLHINCLEYCAEFSTDGAVDKAALRQECGAISARNRHVLELVAAGLWQENGDGYTIHDFLEYNPSAAQLKAKRDSDAQRQRAHREGKSQVVSQRDSEQRHGVTHSVPTQTLKKELQERKGDTPVDNSHNWNPRPFATHPRPRKPQPAYTTGDPRLDAELGWRTPIPEETPTPEPDPPAAEPEPEPDPWVEGDPVQDDIPF